MKCLLDVNALIALGFRNHEFHERVLRWIMPLQASQVLTCSITELGFVRVLSQVPKYALNVSEARNMLLSLKTGDNLSLKFIADDHDISRLPGWAKFPRQTTDAHLAGLAAAHDALLATLDSGIPGAYLIR